MRCRLRQARVAPQCSVAKCAGILYRLTEVMTLVPEKDLVVGRSRLYQKARDGR